MKWHLVSIIIHVISIILFLSGAIYYRITQNVNGITWGLILSGFILSSISAVISYMASKSQIKHLEKDLELCKNQYQTKYMYPSNIKPNFNSC